MLKYYTSRKDLILENVPHNEHSIFITKDNIALRYNKSDVLKPTKQLKVRPEIEGIVHTPQGPHNYTCSPSNEHWVRKNVQSVIATAD